MLMVDEAPVDRDPWAPEPTRRTTFIYIVCSPAAGVGKTLTARLVLDYFLSADRRPLGFETNHLEPALAKFFPHAVTAVDLSSTRGRMALFDRLIVADERPKVVDLWHLTYEPFLRQARELDFFEESWRRGVEPVLLLMTDGTERFVREIRALATQWPGIRIVLVHDEGVTRLPEEAGPPRSLRLVPHVLVLPDLDIVVRRALDQPNLLADRLLREPNPNVSFIIEARVRALLGPFFDQFEGLEMTLALENTSFLG
jgi:hypothetical protein